MLTDALTPVSWRARPRSFVALMSLYESNYIRLGWLVGDLVALDGERRSLAPPECELFLNVLERSRYTTTFNLTYVLPDGLPGADLLRLPDLQVRVYHDAHLAEALAWAARSESDAPPARRFAPDRELGRRWQRNIMLNKWLEYCVERGHSFRLTR
ncbi:MAG: DUF1249 domain-containing protein [Steroidobacteraceae bacterium]